MSKFTNQTNSFPISDIKVLDLSWGVVGPYAAKMMGNFGAKVIKLESIHSPEILRRSTPYKDNKPGLNRAFIFAMINTDKLSISINLHTSRGIEICRHLMCWADVVICNFIGGRLDKMGLSYKDISADNPGLIMVDTTSQGLTGPYAKHPGYGYQAVALAGFTHLTGWPDREAVGPVGAYTDMIAPWFIVIAVMGALIHRDKTGKGQFIDLSQQESSMHMLTPALLQYTLNGEVMNRRGNKDDVAVPHNVYPCKGEERWCALGIFNESQWDALGEVMEKPSWFGQDRYSTPTKRRIHERDLDDLIAGWTSGYEAEELMKKLQKVGIPAGVVKNVKDVFEDPQLAHRDHFQVIEHPELGSYRASKTPVRMSNCPHKPMCRAPLLGEHTEQICREILGMTDEELVQLINEGVIE